MGQSSMSWTGVVCHGGGGVCHEVEWYVMGRGGRGMSWSGVEQYVMEWNGMSWSGTVCHGEE